MSYYYNNALQDAKRIAKNNPKEEYYIITTEDDYFDHDILNAEEYMRECCAFVNFYKRCKAMVSWYPKEPGYEAEYYIEQYAN